MPELGIIEFEKTKKVSIYPNLASDFISFNSKVIIKYCIFFNIIGPQFENKFYFNKIDI